MQRTLTAVAALMLCLLFLGSMVVADQQTVLFDGSDDSASDSSTSGSSNTLLRTRLTSALGASAITDAERMKIKEKFMTQGKMVRDELGIGEDELSDIDAAVLASLGISIDRLRQFKSSDDVKKFVMMIKEKNANLIMRIEKEKEHDADLAAVQAEKKAIREAANQREKLKKLGELLRKIAKDRLGNAAAEARIQAQLDRIKPEVSTVIISDIEAKLKTEIHQVRTEHLTKKGMEVLDKANMLHEKLDAAIVKLEASYDAMADGSKKEVVAKALTRLRALSDRFDAQLETTQAAYEAFTASGGNTLENAKILNKEIVALKVISKRTIDAVRITAHILYRLEHSDDSATVTQAAEIEVEDSIASVDELEVEVEVEQEVVLDTSTTSAMDVMTTTDPTTGGQTA
ncbi:MAG: hypothetical protein IPJ89_05215 [Candidatus Iainarchaeum archaeon]|uniref:DUF5667 domain-containing protein n=1 Tax=Candidatus Iainarchaeum sp. TaxID=3101447 RepID=A0A7T9DJN3_9ARCH|nr:MAG: hypothetical protein IPJ89_05215 [Candidatus Diapherotrites archaeon]